MRIDSLLQMMTGDSGATLLAETTPAVLSRGQNHHKSVNIYPIKMIFSANESSQQGQ